MAYPASFGGVGDVAVDAQGATLTQTVGTQADLSRRLVLANGRLYAANGVIVDAATLASIGAFSESQGEFYGPAIDVARKRAYFVEIGQYGSPLRLHVYDTESLAEIAAHRISGLTFTGTPNLFDPRPTLVGTDSLAFRLSDRIVLLDGVSTL